MLDQMGSRVAVAQEEKTVLLAQCSWCGRMLNGPLVGRRMLMLTSEGKTIPDLSQADTHGICGRCGRKWLKESKRLIRH
ncbi:MAG TPA: hypothetical protein VKR06_41470 [Ktedonosporobacter sp.]|nr:hypothetical protein [Ktedonosporobacter sp.]